MQCDNVHNGTSYHTRNKTTPSPSADMRPIIMRMPRTIADDLRDSTHPPIHDNTEDIHAMLAEYDPENAVDPPSYSVDVPPPSYNTSLARNYTRAHLVLPEIRWQNEPTFFTHITIVYPPKTQLMIPTRINIEGPSLHTSVEPVRLGYNCTFDELQQTIVDELIRRQISTFLGNGYSLKGRLRTACRERRNTLVVRVLHGKKAAEAERSAPLQMHVHEENWQRVRDDLSKQRVKGLVVNVWPEPIVPAISILPV